MFSNGIIYVFVVQNGCNRSCCCRRQCCGGFTQTGFGNSGFIEI